MRGHPPSGAVVAAGVAARAGACAGGARVDCEELSAPPGTSAVTFGDAIVVATNTVTQDDLKYRRLRISSSCPSAAQMPTAKTVKADRRASGVASAGPQGVGILSGFVKNVPEMNSAPPCVAVRAYVSKK